MLQYIKVKNFLSFKDEVCLSFEASRDSFAEDSQVVTMKDGSRLLRFAVIYGYNAAGKSNLISLFNFLTFFWGRKPDDPENGTLVIPFKLNRSSFKETTVFEIAFYAGDVKYRYQLELDEKNVYLEKLSYYKTIQPIVLFERTLKEGRSKIKFNSNAVDISDSASELIELNCLKNASVFVARNQVNIDIPLIDNAKNWLKNHIHQSILSQVELTSWAKEQTVGNPKLVDRLRSFLQQADFNISNIESESQKQEISDAMMEKIRQDKSLPADVKSRLERDRYVENFKTVFTHSVLNGKRRESYKFNEHEESEGTIRTFWLETAVYDLIRNEGLLSIDEIENSLHSRLLEMILFDFLKTPSRSQLLITTHNDGLLDLVDDLIRKDSVCFVEKQKNGSSELYKLTDFKGLNRLSSIRSAYRNKRFGATQFSV